MGKNQQLVKLFFVLFFSTAFIFSFSHYGAKAFEKITKIDGKSSEGTTIGSLNASGKTEDEVNSQLEEKLSDDIKKESVVNTAVVAIKDIPLGLQSIIEKNPEIEIAAESTFSLLDFAKKEKIEDIDSLNVIATGIYQAILPSNFSILERNISSNLPDYSSLGYEARVNPIKKADLVIANPNKAKYVLTLYLENNQLKVKMKGETLVYTYQISTKDEQKLAPKTIVQYSPLLLPGKTKVQTKGEEGIIVKVYREIFQGDQLIKTELISEDYYPPSYQVEIHGLEGTQVITQPTDTTVNQVDTTHQSIETSTTDDQTATTSDPEQQETSESDLWGNTNEQPK